MGMIWSYLKYGVMANFVPRDVRDLDKGVNAHLGELGGRPGLIWSLWSGSMLPFFDRNPAT